MKCMRAPPAFMRKVNKPMDGRYNLKIELNCSRADFSLFGPYLHTGKCGGTIFCHKIFYLIESKEKKNVFTEKDER